MDCHFFPFSVSCSLFLIFLFFLVNGFLGIVVFEANFEQRQVGTVDVPQVNVLKQKMEVFGITCTDSCVPGRYDYVLCPVVSWFFLFSFFYENFAISSVCIYVVSSKVYLNREYPDYSYCLL